MVMIPIVQFGGMRPPNVRGEISELSRRMGEGLKDALGDEPVRADFVLEVLAVWVAALITIHSSSQEHLAEHFAEVLAEKLGE